MAHFPFSHAYLKKHPATIMPPDVPSEIKTGGGTFANSKPYVVAQKEQREVALKRSVQMDTGSVK